MGRIDELLHDSVIDRGNYYAQIWNVKTALSAGIAALDMLNSSQREAALAIARGQSVENTECTYVLMTKSQIQAYEEMLAEKGENEDSDLSPTAATLRAKGRHLRSGQGRKSG